MLVNACRVVVEALGYQDERGERQGAFGGLVRCENKWKDEWGEIDWRGVFSEDLWEVFPDLWAFF